MALRQSISTTRSTSQAGAPSVLSSQVNTSSNNLRHATVNASIKIAGVLLFVIMCSLIVMSAQASGRQANEEFNNANRDSASALHSDRSAPAAANALTDTDDKTTGSVTSTPQSNSSSNNVSLTVDGQTTQVPANTSVQKSVSTADGTVNVTLNSNSNGTSSNNSFTSTTVMNNSSSISSNNGAISSGGSDSYDY